MARIGRLVTLFFALALVSSERIAAAPAQVANAPLLAWPHEQSDLKPDPSITWGRLENGLRYAILPHATPHQRAAVCLIVLAGSYHEQNDELGYAHFVEHMAFRDTRGYPGDTAIRTLQSLGLSFGPHVNAQTGYFRTHYAFGNIPSDDPAAVTTSLKILRAMADGILFEPAAVESERDVIFGERRLRSETSAQLWSDELEYLAPRRQNLRQQELAAAFDRARWPYRHPIGSTKTLKAAHPKKLQTFYDRWYRPERMIVTVVGDIAVDQTEELVREIFASIVARGPAPKEIPIEDVPTRPKNGTPVVAVQGYAALPAVEIALGTASKRSTPDTIGRRRDQLARQLALQLLTTRLVRATERVGAPFTAASAALMHAVPGHEVIAARVTCLPSLWRQALTSLDLELRRARRDGFSDLEFERAVQWKSKRSFAAIQQFKTENSLNVVRGLGFAIADGIVFTSAEVDNALDQEQLSALTAERCRDALRELFPTTRTFVCLVGGFGDEGTPSVRFVRAHLRESRALEPEPYGQIAPAKLFPYTDFGPPAVVVESHHSGALDSDLIRFANGVRLNVKRTEFEPGRVHFIVRFGGGRLACPPDKPGLDTRVIAWALGGIRDLSAEEERTALADLSGWSNNVTAAAEAFTWVGAGAASQLSRALEATFAHFVYPAFHDADWPRSFESARRQLAPAEMTAGGTARRVMIDRLSGHHPAWRFPNLEEVSLRTLEEFTAWFPSQLTAAGMEIAIVGDVEPAKAIEAVARTFGTLPSAPGEDPYAERRRVSFPSKAFSETVAFNGRNGVASVVLAWPATEAQSFVERLRGVVLATILHDRLRLKLRSEMGEAYAPSASFIWNDAFIPSPTYMLCEIDCAPTHAERVASAVRALVARLAQDGVTIEEFERARSPHVRSAESRLRSNRSWLTVLATAQSQSDEAESWLRAQKDYRTMTASDVSTMARVLFASDRQCQVLAVPISKEAEMLNARGLKAYGHRHYGQALAFFDQAIAENSAYAQAYYNRGRSKQALRDRSGARGDYDRALALSPNEPRAYLQRGLLKRAEGELSGAIADLDRWIGLNPADANSRVERGTTKAKMGDHAGALEDFDQAIALNPSVPELFEQRAAVKEAAGDKAGATSDRAQAKALRQKSGAKAR